MMDWLSIILIGTLLSVVIALAVILYTAKKNANKLLILYLDTDETAQFLNKTSETGENLIHQGKKFNLTRVKPKIVRKVFGNRKMYVLSYDQTEPLIFAKKSIEPVQKPETFKDVTEMSVLKSFLTRTRQDKKYDIMQLIFGIGIGAMLILILHFAKILPV